MRPEIKFHCDSKRNFRNEKNTVRAFLYTDYAIEPHNHDFYEMNIIFKGRGMHLIEDSHISVKAGDVFVIPPMTVHSYYDTSGLDVYHVLLHKRFVSENSGESVNMPGFLQLVEIEPFLRRNFCDSAFLHLSQNQLAQLKNDLSMIEDGGFFDNDELAALKHHTMWKILYWLSYLLYLQLSSEKGVLSNKYENNIIKSLEYIHQHYGEKITIENLCKITFLSRSTFLRSFSAICNCTPMHYLNRYRVKKALEMLESTSASKTETAHACGFYDLSHMERMIKNEQYTE